MKIVVIAEDIAVEVFHNWKDVKRHYNLEKTDFVKHGDDYIVRMDPETYRVSKDVKLIEDVVSAKVFGKKAVDWHTAIATAIATVIAITFIM